MMSSCQKINDTGLNEMSKALETCSSLQSISLNFTRCYELTDAALGDIGSSLKNLTSSSFKQASLCFNK